MKKKHLIIALSIAAVLLIAGAVLFAVRAMDKSTDIRIVLTWGAEPQDLELELTGAVPGTGEPFTINYEQKELEGYAWKDLDDRSGFGPETIAITQRFDAPVICTVSDYTNRNAARSTALSESGAKVEVYKGSKLIDTFTPDAGQPALKWDVFQLMPDGSIEALNAYAGGNEPDAPASAPAVIDPSQLAEDKINIVLAWGELPANLDLDLSLSGTLPGSDEAFTINWQNSKVADYAVMESDVRSSAYGFELITVSQLFDAPVICSVSDYTNRNAAQSTALSESGAKVDVYKGSELIATFTVEPGQPALKWDVFQLMPDGSIEALNAYAAGNQPDVSASAPAVTGPALSAEDQINIVLTWGAEPADLDLELTGTVPGTNEAFKIVGLTTELAGYAVKDADARDGFGPDTIAITRRFDAPVICTVSDRTNHVYEHSTALSESGAKVEVYKGNKLIATFTPDAGRPAVEWNVFQLMPDGSIETLNTYTPETHIPADFGADEYHVVMKWYAGVRDLDLQITGSVPGTDDPFTVTWDSPELTNYAALYCDDRAYNSPYCATETICIFQPFDAPITCTVLDNDQRYVKPWIYDPMDESNITVEIYKGSEVIASFTSTPGHSGMMRWDVCQLMPDGSVVAIDTYSDTGLAAPYRLLPTMEDATAVGLTWNDEVVEDLDLHFLTYNESNGQYHSISDKTPGRYNAYYFDEFAPEEAAGYEVIGIKTAGRSDNPVLVTVHDYTNHANSESSALSDSEAFVWKLDGSGKKIEASFAVQPGMTGNEWAVCWLMPDGSILPVDEYLPGTDAANVGRVVYERGVQ